MDVLGPSKQRGLSLSSVLIMLIHRYQTATRAALMIEHCLYDVRRMA